MLTPTLHKSLAQQRYARSISGHQETCWTQIWCNVGVKFFRFLPWAIFYEWMVWEGFTDLLQCAGIVKVEVYFRKETTYHSQSSTWYLFDLSRKLDDAWMSSMFIQRHFYIGMSSYRWHPQKNLLRKRVSSGARPEHKRESRENRERSRRCNRGRKSHKTTVSLNGMGRRGK